MLPSLRKQRTGQSLIEVVVAMGMVVFFGAAFVTLVSTNYGRLEQSRDQSQATLLAQEAINVIRARAGSNFDAITTGSFGLNHDTGELTPGSDTTQTGDSENATEFTRTIEIDILNRDTNGTPTPNNQAGSPDPSSRFVRVMVEWENQYKSGTIQMFTIISSWSKGGSIVFDTEADFSAPGSQYHTTQALNEIFNGEVRASQVGGLETPILRALTPEVILESSGQNYAMILSNDEIYVVNENDLKVFSVGNISAPVIAERTATLLTTKNIVEGRAIALSDTHIFVGTGNNSSEIQIYDRATFSEVAWDLPGNGNIIDMTYDKQTKMLLVSRVAAANEPNFMIVDLSGNISSSLPAVTAVSIGNESLTALTSDGKYAYVGTNTNRIFTVCLWNNCGHTPQSIIAFSPSNSPVRALDILRDTLYVGRDVNASEPEMMSFQIKWNVPQTTVSLEPRGTFELGASVTAVMADQELNRVIATTERGTAAQDDAVVFSPSLQKISGIKANAGGGTNCIDLGYEAGRLFMSCDIAGRTVLTVAEDSAGRSMYAPYSSYTTPITCVSGTFTKWDLLSFDESGLGYSDIQVRSADTAQEIVTLPWLGDGPGTSLTPHSAFTDDTIWHDIGSLAAKPCIQARVRLHATAFCPLYLETLIFTYE